MLGHLGPTICGGTVALSVELARTALQALADAMSATVKDAARAIIAVTEAKLSRAIRSTSLGDAPGRLALVVYGGAAGLHAVAVARSLGIGHVIVPPAPGLQCALGALGADVVVEEVAACKEELGESVSSHLVAELDRLAERATRALIEEGVAADDRSVERRLRARYEGQGIDAELELSASPISSMDRATFERAHQAAYGYRLSRKVEIVRLSARGVGRARAVTRISPRIIGWPRRGSRDVDGVMTPIYRRDRLRSATIVKGPAIIEELSATFYLPKGASASVDRDGSLDVTP